jgi:A/G-specific adenine glycosylase
VEADKKLPFKKLLLQVRNELSINEDDFSAEPGMFEITQQLTHQQIHFNFLAIDMKKKVSLPGYEWIAIRKLEKYPFPKTIRDLLYRYAKR